MIVLFDIDSTLVTIEGMDVIATWKGLGDEVAEITEKTMSGEMSFENAFPSKVDVLAPSIGELERLGETYKQSLVPNLINVLEKLKNKGVKLGIVTGNFEIAVNIFCDHLQFEKGLRFFNRINFKANGSYLGFNKNQILAKDTGKALVISNLKAKYIDEKVYFVGDSVGDMMTQETADKFIGYGGVVVREKVKSEAELYIYDMLELLDIVDAYFEN